MRILKPEIAKLADLAAKLGALTASGEAGGITPADANWLAGLVAPQLQARKPDRRESPRLIRVRLYRAGDAEPAADSAPELPADQPGDWSVSGLPGVALALASSAAAFHTKGVIIGLDKPELDRRIKGLRPTLSRRGGEATWRVPYTVGGEVWTARVDVVNARCC